MSPRPTNKRRPQMTGLVLTAGGARGAYQAGVLKRIGEIKALQRGPSPFRIIAGASAGAINGATLACHQSDLHLGAEKLATLWGSLTFDSVIRYDMPALANTARKMVLDMTLGGLIGAGRLDALMNTAPLRVFLGAHMDFSGIADAVKRGQLYALAITATGYHSGKSFTFVQGAPGHPLWNKSRRVALTAQITLEHVCASAAIPLVFPPVALTVNGGTAYFGDGALRLVTPLSPAIRLGATRLLAIGVRCANVADDLLREELAASPVTAPEHMQRPPLSQILGVFMNAIFLDHLDADLDHLKRMNDLISAYPASVRANPMHALSEPMRIVRPLSISPSEDIAILAKTLAHRMPRAIRYVMDGLGTPDAKSADLTSFLLFDSAFTRELIQLGYRDTAKRADEIEAFLLDDTSRE
jgi:NTE family protein